MIPLTPILTVIPMNSTLESSTYIILSCTTDSNGTITYQFLRDDDTIISQSNGTYVHQNIQTSDTGNYTCTVTINGVVSLTSREITKTVVGKYFINCDRNISQNENVTEIVLLISEENMPLTIER